MSFGGPMNVSLSPSPPDRGSFPLDHLGECKTHMLKYLNCIKNTDDHSSCRDLTKRYLECRMEKELMDKTDFVELGFISQKKSLGQADNTSK
ncbi:hypothetical protein BB561_002039 [Smittium simulii]|uniref:CHCH domain-containing protein n=1 Tax=Smittium simulii TaxID=133385 RepID=A0A2T9YS68_9FUNG|nr:hypothetical protein BB561_002039 [Smittium simulii]